MADVDSAKTLTVLGCGKLDIMTSIYSTSENSNICEAKALWGLLSFLASLLL